MRTNRRESRRMVLEQLEDRRLLYADYIACNGDGTLTITGTSSADDIAVSMNGSYEVTINTNTVPCDDRAGVALASDVKAISVAGGNGNDEIDLSAISGTALSFFSHITGGDVTISGGSGNDSKAIASNHPTVLQAA